MTRVSRDRIRNTGNAARRGYGPSTGPKPRKPAAERGRTTETGHETGKFPAGFSRWRSGDAV